MEQPIAPLSARPVRYLPARAVELRAMGETARDEATAAALVRLAGRFEAMAQRLRPPNDLAGGR
jgi:hypothetical protein